MNRSFVQEIAGGKLPPERANRLNFPDLLTGISKQHEKYSVFASISRRQFVSGYYWVFISGLGKPNGNRAVVTYQIRPSQ